MMKINHFCKQDISDRPIILWGGVMYGEIAYEVITNIYGGTVEAIVDNKYAKVPWFDKDCIRSSELNKYSSADLIICGANSFQIIAKEAEAFENDIRVFDLSKILEDYRLFFS